MGAQVEVRPEELAALAAELTALVAELTGEAEDCRAAAALFGEALAGPEGWRAGALAMACGTLADRIAGNAAVVAGTLAAAVAAYRGLDGALAAGVAAVPLPRTPR